MKKILALASVFLGCLHISEAQQVDFCRYFYLDISTKIVEGHSVQSYSPEIKSGKHDALAIFMKEHDNRFNYLLWNKLGDLNPVADLYPDTTKMEAALCSLLQGNKRFLSYLQNLVPKSLRDPGLKQDTFTVDDMMYAASRFFYCVEIEESDTLIISHICVRMDDQVIISPNHDLTLLEAFTFEGIFHALLNEDKPKFDANFDRYIKDTRDRYKDNAKDLDALLVTVRHECFALMENDQDLKESLLNYYDANRNNLNFIIE